ncbi:hypothetical protein PpBr36_08309 [Pyricularia pennisetigena]|uniref:hypothetical protein n=1 Tax=Pyricularia pennisetigena TaxID=1578925 RepID=UPI0011501E82|nr:hypothetical protein PpBr36_08309 [Pyricularia pennisetigena]TLS24085.1 hypothetical protein PpBr36_08309 [Pyricularia pennisetigena]
MVEVVKSWAAGVGGLVMYVVMFRAVLRQEISFVFTSSRLKRPVDRHLLVRVRNGQPPVARPPSTVLLFRNPHEILMFLRIKLHCKTTSSTSPRHAAVLLSVATTILHVGLESKLLEHPTVAGPELVQIHEPAHAGGAQARLLAQLADGGLEDGPVAARLGHAAGRLPQVRHEVGRCALDEKQPPGAVGMKDDGADDEGVQAGLGVDVLGDRDVVLEKI